MTSTDASAQRLRRPRAKPHRVSLADTVGSSSTTKNVVVLGGSYGGIHAATVLANRLPPSHRVILVERNSHFNHLYVFPRFSTLPGHEHKAFIPYSSIFKDAPKRVSAQPVAGPSQSGPSPPTQSSSSEQMLGMGSIGGRTLGKQPSRLSDTSDEARPARSNEDSSPSRSSSPDSTAFFGDDSIRLDRSRLRRRMGDPVSPASSIASSYASQPPLDTLRSDDDTAERAAKLASPRGMEQALKVDASASRSEEPLGRPEIEVEDLSTALEKGIDLQQSEQSQESTPTTGRTFDSSSPHLVLQANVTDITPSHVVVESVEEAQEGPRLWSIDRVSIPYSHLIYAMGSHLPDPLRTEARMKRNGVAWMQEFQKRVKGSHEIVLVGGGALGVEFATDIKSVYPDKEVTLIHSRKQLLPNFDVEVHEIAHRRLVELGVNLVLGERLALTEGCPRGSTVQPEQAVEAPHAPPSGDVCPPSAKRGGEGPQARNEGMCLGDGRKRVKTTGGKEFECDLLLLCTGQQPNSGLMAHLSPTSVDPSTRLIRVMRSLQVKVPDPQGSMAQMPFDPRPPCGDCDCFLDKKAAGQTTDEAGPIAATSTVSTDGGDAALTNVYAIGDVVDAFGALNAGYQAWAMADVAADNILCDIEGQQAQTANAPLKRFEPAANMLKLSLGLGKMVFQGPPDERTGRPSVEVREDPEDLAVEGVWQFMAGMSTEDMYL